MKVLIIGSGGREHALAWKLSQSPQVKEIYCAPGNGGMRGFCIPVCVDVKDLKSLAVFAQKKQIDLTVVGPEDPLVEGISDIFKAKGLLIYGPSKNAAMLEGSKDFTRQICSRSGIKIAEGRTFTVISQALAYLDKQSYPVVIKADGLAAGKGVTIAQNHAQAVAAVKDAMEQKIFGNAGNKIVIEEFLKGYEVSVLSICSGTDAVVLAPSQDHKRIFDHDKGPNTGGMGTFSPVPAFSPQQLQWTKDHIFVPVLKTMLNQGMPYIGTLFAGLMVLEDHDIRVLEFNVRFGDPETQAILPRFQGDFFEMLYRASKGEPLTDISLKWAEESCVCVVAASSGYPGSYKKGFEIKGLDQPLEKDCTVFHAGTEKKQDRLFTSGGRVLSVASLGKDLKEAKEKSYRALKQIHFDGMYYRTDISDKAGI
ncbi:MAG: phosphoribosylamine--glycine ligase [Candidatus Aureabacteria bacterium]|nr:phosphoribosylamine--glycine ligase [Candidatus Auribacterota bacterium]